MELKNIAMDKYVSSRLEGLDQEVSFLLARLESYRYLMDFTYYSGEPLSEKNFNEMAYISKDIKFTQTAEFAARAAANEKSKSPAV
jgi:hypothetical protein